MAIPEVHSSESGTSNDARSQFDILSTYKSILASDADITMPMAAIEALIQLLAATPSCTAMETVETVQAQSRVLLDAFPNPVPLKAGTDLFLQMLQHSLRRQAAPSQLTRPTTPTTTTPTTTARKKRNNVQDDFPAAAASVPSFDDTRRRLVTSNRQFVAEAKKARDTLARRGARFVRDGATVMTAGGSRAVLALLRAAADEGKRFRVLYVVDTEADEAAADRLDAMPGVEVRRVPAAGAAHALKTSNGQPGKGVDVVFVGAEVVCGNGGLLSRLGTYQLAALAAAVPGSTKVVCAAETHKIVRGFPLMADLSRFGVDAEAARVDYTPPDLVHSIVTEDGVKAPIRIFDYVLEMFM